MAGPWKPSTELRTLLAVHTQLSPQHSEVGDYNYTLFTDGLKVQRSRNFAWGHTASECSWVEMLRFREVQSEGTSGNPLMLWLPQALPPLHHLHLLNTEATRVRGQPLTSPSISLDPPGKKKHYGRPGSRTPDSEANLPLSSRTASRGPQFTPHQNWESIIAPTWLSLRGNHEVILIQCLEHRKCFLNTCYYYHYYGRFLFISLLSFLTTLIIRQQLPKFLLCAKPCAWPWTDYLVELIGAKAYRSHCIGKESRKDKHVYELTLLYDACQCNELRKRNGRDKENWKTEDEFHHLQMLLMYIWEIQENLL